MPTYKLSKSSITVISVLAIAVILLLFLIYYFKNDNKNASQTINSTTNTSNQQNSNISIKENSNPPTIISAKKQSDHPSEQETLYDTKSDLTIQPIDPEKDPGNQIN